MSDIALGIVFLLTASIVFGSRRWALVSMMAGVLFLSYGQGLDVLGLNLYPIRILATFGFFRVIARREFSAFDLNGVDRAFFLAYSYMLTIFLLRSNFGDATSTSVAQVSTMGKIGAFADSALCYVTFRGLIRDTDDVSDLLRKLAFLLVPFVCLLCVERLTGNNPFATVGAAPHIWAEAGGRLRCWGSFSHPSLLGTMGASLLPLYIGLVLSKTNRSIGVVGSILSLAVVILSSSGGPLNFVAVVIAGWLLWRMRKRMAMVRHWIAGMFAFLWVAMYLRNGDHIWWLPAILSRISGGDGWHRSRLMDLAFGHLNQWWLAGMPLDLTRDWFPYLVGGAVDVTNYYLLIGFDSGIIGIVFFSVLLVRGFRFVGLALATTNLDAKSPSLEQALIWGLGVAVAGHMANWLAITYFDQTQVIWCMQIAAISGLSTYIRGHHTE